MIAAFIHLYLYFVPLFSYSTRSVLHFLLQIFSQRLNLLRNLETIKVLRKGAAKICFDLRLENLLHLVSNVYLGYVI